MAWPTKEERAAKAAQETSESTPDAAPVAAPVAAAEPSPLRDPEDAFLETLSVAQMKVWAKLPYRPELTDEFIDSLSAEQAAAYQRIELKRNLKKLFTSGAELDVRPLQQSEDAYYFLDRPQAAGGKGIREEDAPPGSILYPRDVPVPKKTSKSGLIDWDDMVTFVPEDPHMTTITVHGVRVDITPGEENTIPRAHYGIYQDCTLERIANARGITRHSRTPRIPIDMESAGPLRPLILRGPADTSSIPAGGNEDAA